MKSEVTAESEVVSGASEMCIIIRTKYNFENIFQKHERDLNI